MKNSRTPEKGRSTLEAGDKKQSIRTYQERYTPETNLAQLFKKTSEDGFSYHRRLNTQHRCELESKHVQVQMLDDSRLQQRQQVNLLQRPPRNPVTGFGVVSGRKEGIGIVEQDMSKSQGFFKLLRRDAQADSVAEQSASITGIKRLSKTYESKIPYISIDAKHCDQVDVNHRKQMANERCQGSPEIKRLLTEYAAEGELRPGAPADGNQSLSTSLIKMQPADRSCSRQSKKLDPQRLNSDCVRVLMNEQNLREMEALNKGKFVKETNKLINERRNESFNVKKIFNFGEGVNRIRYEDYMKNLRTTQPPAAQQQTGKKFFTQNAQNTTDMFRGSIDYTYATSSQDCHQHIPRNAAEPQSKFFNQNPTSYKKDANLIISKNNQSISKAARTKWRN